MAVDLAKRLATLAKRQLLVGIPKEKDTRQADANQPAGPIGNAALAYIHSTGDPARNLPARPFLQPAIDEMKQEIASRLGAIGKAVIDGTVTDIDAQLSAIGQLAADRARAKITAGIPPPLKPSTVRGRGRRSAGSRYRRKATGQEQADFNARFDAGQATMADSPTTPLYDTGQMARAITYVIRDK